MFYSSAMPKRMGCASVLKMNFKISENRFLRTLFKDIRFPNSTHRLMCYEKMKHLFLWHRTNEIPKAQPDFYRFPNRPHRSHRLYILCNRLGGRPLVMFQTEPNLFDRNSVRLLSVAYFSRVSNTSSVVVGTSDMDTWYHPNPLLTLGYLSDRLYSQRHL